MRHLAVAQRPTNAQMNLCQIDQAKSLHPSDLAKLMPDLDLPFLPKDYHQYYARTHHNSEIGKR
jgi:hypothetical protein